MQMFLAVFLTYLPYTLVTAFTPGPNNIIALYTISRNGWSGGKGAILGICTGFFCVMMACALFCYELEKYIPSLANILKYVGAVYIVWLAIHIARSKPDESGAGQITFWKGLLLQFVNVKIIMYAINTFTGYVLPANNDLPFLLLHGVCVTVIGMAGTVTWAMAGSFLQRFLAKYYRPFNYLMAVVLIFCALKMI